MILETSLKNSVAKNINFLLGDQNLLSVLSQKIFNLFYLKLKVCQTEKLSSSKAILSSRHFVFLKTGFGKGPRIALVVRTHLIKSPPDYGRNGFKSFHWS